VDLQGIAYSGQPTPEVFRAVDPPRAVLLDLVTLFPRQPHEPGHYSPMGLQMHGIVEGKLTCWGLCEQGHWWGLVTYPIAFGAEQKPVTHWVPGWVLKQKH
jgi:hypothetical protein